jgi:hypothetical protein
MAAIKPATSAGCGVHWSMGIAVEHRCHDREISGGIGLSLLGILAASSGVERSIQIVPMKRFLMTAIACSLLAATVYAVPADSNFGVGPQYDTTHVYVRPEDFDGFVASLVATFGGTTTKQGVFTVTPTPSQTMSQLVLTPAGTLSVFGFKTPVPYPFGLERTGYLVTDLDAAVRAAQADGADVLVTPFNDPIGKDAVIQWPGGVNMQLYWHTTPPSYPALKTIPENRVYVSPDRATPSFTASWRFRTGSCLGRCARAGSRDWARRRTPTARPHLFGPSARWRY